MAEISGSGRGTTPLPKSLAHLKREISEKKWVEARQWTGGRTSKAKYRMPKSQGPDGTVARSTKKLASRFNQVKTGHCLTGEYLHWTKNRPTPSVGGAGTRPRLGSTSSRCVRSGRPNGKFCGRRCRRTPGGGRADGKYGTSWPMRGAVWRY